MLRRSALKLRIEVRDVEKGSMVPRHYEFTEGPVHVGRAASGHVVLDEQPISRLQLVFQEIHGAWQVTHRGSAVPTILNREPLAPERPTRLTDRDMIQVGPFELRIAIAGVSEVPELRRSEERRVGKECRSRWSECH